MALTQVKTAGIAADAVTGAKVADDQIDSEHYIAASIDNEHLANNAVDSDELAAGSVDIAHLATGTDGQIITWGADGAATAVGPGTDGQVLTSTGAGSPPAFETISTSDTLSFRNKIINGAMQIHQRGGTSTTTAGYTLDRWKAASGNDGAWAITQSTTAPDGFSNSLKIDCTTADASLAASQYAQLNYKIEAQDLQDLAFGTSSAKSITLSFWVRSNKTGDFNVAIGQTDNSDKQVGAVYTINIADTWEKKTMTWAGDTSGVINNDNGQGFQISWNLALGTDRTSGTTRSTWTAYADADFGAGQVVNIMDNTANEWLISGVQLEVGSTATDFEHRSYGDELRRCQRYYIKDTRTRGNGGNSVATNELDSIAGVDVDFPTIMRASPTIATLGGNYRNGGDSDAQVISDTGFTWGRKFTGTANTWTTIVAYTIGGYTADAEL